LITCIKYEDFPEVLRLCEDIHSQQRCSGYGYPFSKQRVMQQLFQAMDDSNEYIYVYRDGKTLRGLIWLECMGWKFNSDSKRLVEHLWHADSALRKRDRVSALKALLKQADELAETLGIDVQSVSQPKVFHTQNYLQSLGYGLHEKVYIKTNS
jgi:hypothetical protein